MKAIKTALKLFVSAFLVMIVVASAAGGLATFKASGNVATQESLSTEPATARIVAGKLRIFSNQGRGRSGSTYLCRIFAEFSTPGHRFVDAVRWQNVFWKEQRPPENCAENLIGKQIPVRVKSAHGDRPAGYDSRLYPPSVPKAMQPGDVVLYLLGVVVGLFLLWRLWRKQIPGRIQ